MLNSFFTYKQPSKLYTGPHLVFSHKPQTSIFAPPGETATYLGKKTQIQKKENLSLETKRSMETKKIDFCSMTSHSMGFHMNAHIYLTSFIVVHRSKQAT